MSARLQEYEYYSIKQFGNVQQLISTKISEVQRKGKAPLQRRLIMASDCQPTDNISRWNRVQVAKQHPGTGKPSSNQASRLIAWNEQPFSIQRINVVAANKRARKEQKNQKKSEENVLFCETGNFTEILQKFHRKGAKCNFLVVILHIYC